MSSISDRRTTSNLDLTDLSFQEYPQVVVRGNGSTVQLAFPVTTATINSFVNGILVPETINRNQPL